MSLAIRTIATSIAGLSVTGLTIKDMDEIPEQATAVPVLFPDPSGFISNIRVTVDSYGSNVAKKTVEYTLNYRCCYAPVGAERGEYAIYPGMVTVFCALVDALLANDALTGVVDITPDNLTSFGVVQDVAGGGFYGFDVALHCSEFVN